MKILIVDDESIGRKSMRYMLSAYGECTLAENAAGTLAEFQKAWDDWRPFSLITLDIELPDMSGLALLAQIRRMEEEKSIPKDERVKIIMVTSHSHKDTVVECLKAGCDEFIIKPADKDGIAAKLSKIGL